MNQPPAPRTSRLTILLATCALLIASAGTVDAVVHAADTGSQCGGGDEPSCGGPAPLTGSVLDVSPDGRTLMGVFNCGGRLEVRETGTKVVVTYIAPQIAPGAASCARVPLTVKLDMPLGNRGVVDGVTGAPIPVTR